MRSSGRLAVLLSVLASVTLLSQSSDPGVLYQQALRRETLLRQELDAAKAGTPGGLLLDRIRILVGSYEDLARLFSASETSWFGIEHLPLGYTDFTRLPTLKDGVFFNAPYQEGKRGIQLERMPPYVTTFNPGYDPSLPVYKPLPMFEAMKAALAQPKPLPSPWDRPRPSNATTQPASVRVVCTSQVVSQSVLS